MEDLFSYLRQVLYKFGYIIVCVLVRRLRPIKLQICRNGVVDGFQLHCSCGFLSIRHCGLLNGSHNCILRDTVRESELIEICLVLLDTKLECSISLCILRVEIVEVYLLTLQFRILAHMKSKLGELLC